MTICAHTPCTCTVEGEGTYCSPVCRQGLEVSDAAPCSCGHDECDATG